MPEKKRGGARWVVGGRKYNGGKRTGSGRLVVSVTFDKPTAQSLRIVCLALYGAADKTTTTKHVTNLVLADHQAWDQQVQENAEEASV